MTEPKSAPAAQTNQRLHPAQPYDAFPCQRPCQAWLPPLYISQLPLLLPCRRCACTLQAKAARAARRAQKEPLPRLFLHWLSRASTAQHSARGSARKPMQHSSKRTQQPNTQRSAPVMTGLAISERQMGQSSSSPACRTQAQSLACNLAQQPRASSFLPGAPWHLPAQPSPQKPAVEQRHPPSIHNNGGSSQPSQSIRPLAPHTPPNYPSTRLSPTYPPTHHALTHPPTHLPTLSSSMSWAASSGVRPLSADASAANTGSSCGHSAGWSQICTAQGWNICVGGWVGACGCRRVGKEGRPGGGGGWVVGGWDYMQKSKRSVATHALARSISLHARPFPGLPPPFPRSPPQNPPTHTLLTDVGCPYPTPAGAG